MHKFFHFPVSYMFISYVLYDMYGKRRSSMAIHGSKVESYIMISWQIVPGVIRVVDCV